jgi:hypothetical protein
VLKSSIEYFDTKIKSTINNSAQRRIPPILVENIGIRYPDWYRQLKNTEYNISDH